MPMSGEWLCLRFSLRGWWPNYYDLTQDECIFGCPCASFDCQPEKKSVLVLNTAYSSNKPLLINFNGENSIIRIQK